MSVVSGTISNVKLGNNFYDCLSIYIIFNLAKNEWNIDVFDKKQNIGVFTDKNLPTQFKPFLQAAHMRLSICY